MSDIAEAVDRARLLLESHRFDEALEVLLQAEQAHPGDEDLLPEVATVLIERGFLRLGEDDRAGAKADFEQSIAKSETAAAHLGLAEIERRSRRFAEARGCFERALEVDPEFAAAREGAAAMLLAMGDAAGAEAEFRALAESSPSPGTFLGLATALESLARPDEAREVVEAALHRFPSDVGVLIAAVRRGDPERRSELLARAIERNHRSFDAWFETAKLRCEEGNLNEAAEALEECVRMNADLTRARCEEEFADPRSPFFAQAEFVRDRLN